MTHAMLPSLWRGTPTGSRLVGTHGHAKLGSPCKRMLGSRRGVVKWLLSVDEVISQMRFRSGPSSVELGFRLDGHGDINTRHQQR